MSPDDLQAKLNGHPFKPFRLKLSTNETIDVLNPMMVIVSRSSAIMPVSTFKSDAGYDLVQRWKTVSLDHIVTFEDITSSQFNGRKGGKK